MNLPQTSQRTPYFFALTGVRALAAYLVFMQHHKPHFPFLEWLVAGRFQMGHLGVSLFFVLSGFLITYRYADQFLSGNINLRKYFTYRFARIYPLYFFLTIVILIWSKNFNGWEWFLNFTLLKGFFDKEKFSGIFQGWSLTVEECFYLSAPFLFVFFRKYGVLTVAAIMALGIGLVEISRMAGSTSFMANQSFMLTVTFFGRCFEFYCGYWLARKLQNSEKQVYSEKGNLLTYSGLGMLMGGLILVNLVANKGITLSPEIPLENLVNVLLLPLFITVFYWGLTTENTLISRILSTRLAQVLGRSSFAFYLIHAGLFAEFIYFHLSKNSWLIFGLLNLAAMLIYYFLEQPVNKFIRKRI